MEYRYSSTLSLTSELYWGGGQRHVPAALSRERSGTHCIGGWVVRRASLDGCRKSRLHRQPVASRYTGRAIPADHIDRRMGMLQQTASDNQTT